MAKKNTTETDTQPQIAPYADAITDQRQSSRLSGSALLNPEAYIGQYVVVHSAPTAWIGCLVSIERREEAVGCVLADAGLWVNGELKDVVRPGLKASKDTDSSHHHIAYIPIVTAMQPAASPSTINAWKQRYRGRRPGNPEMITLENYARSTDQDVDTCAKAVTVAFTAGQKGFDSLVGAVGPFADEVGFPAAAVASVLLSDVLTRTW